MPLHGLECKRQSRGHDSIMLLKSSNCSTNKGTETQGDPDICKRCQKIDFDSVFIQKANEKIGTFVAHVGCISQGWLDSKCPFCRFLARIVVEFGTLEEQGDQEYSLRAFPSSSTIGHIVRRQSPQLMPKISQTAVLGLVVTERSNSQRPQRHSQRVLKDWGYIYPTSFPKQVDPPYLLGRAINAHVIDYELVKSWIQFCTDYHTDPCTQIIRTKSLPFDFRVIDCSTRKVIQAQDHCQYVAMSYVWGLKDKDPTKHKVCRETGKMPDDLPAVIDDAITVVLGLGLQFLWVDRYCIRQDDEEDMRMQIPWMATIYANACITIIAAAGKDSSFGLPGVGRPRKEQPTIQVGHQTLVCTLPDPHHIIGSSTWMTRGWVYQEALFSRRRLIFSPDQIYFECNNMQCYESIHHPLNVIHTKDLSRLRSCIRQGIFRGGFGERRWPLSTHIVNFTSKLLTYEKDKLFAMLGIYKAFQEQMNPVHVVFGVPVEFDMDLINWKQQSAMRKQYAVNPWKLHASFARGLCWLLKQPGELLFFPSWSWTGWTGSLSNWMSFETLSKQEDPEITFKIKFHGGTQDLHSAWTNSLGNLHYMSNDTLDIEAWSFPITIVPEPSQTDTQSSISYSSSYLAQLDLGSGMIAYSPFLVTEQVTEYLHDKLCSKTWTCIVLAYRKQASRAPVVLVLRESTKYAERIGLVDFWTAWGSDEYGNRYHIVVDDRKIVRSRWKGALW